MPHPDDERIQARARRVEVSDDTLTAHLEDGRSISCPLLWYPTLAEAPTDERQNHRLIGKGAGIHWPDLDEDISIRGMRLGRSSQFGRKTSSSAPEAGSIRDPDRPGKEA